MSDLQDALNDTLIHSTLRDYSGLSGIGASCRRALQYQHYWSYEDSYTTRIQRLFNVGHDAEDIMIADLATQGLTVHSAQKEIIGFAGHWKGHIDGILEDSTLWEAKTHNEKSFNDLEKKKVKESKPGHYAQMTAYMGYLELDLAMYMALNKNTSKYYIEWVNFDDEYFRELKAKSADIITTDSLFKRIGNNSPAWFECKFCSASDVCFGKKDINKTCRSCKHVDIVDKGGWECGLHNEKLSSGRQLLACVDY